ncbi:unnamed protein product [Prunus brigantina]
MELELQGQPGSSGLGSSGSHVVSIHDEELPRHIRFLSPSAFVDYNAYYNLQAKATRGILNDYDNPKQKQVDDNNKPKHRTKFTYTEKWIFFLISLGLETISASFDQLSSRSKPHYALYGMLLAIAAVLICICELIQKGYRERVEFKRWGRIWWYYHPYLPNRRFDHLQDQDHSEGYLVMFLTFLDYLLPSLSVFARQFSMFTSFGIIKILSKPPFCLPSSLYVWVLQD